ncbi:hypothetical protein L6164_001469 [Bauhinia variegata]|uniref:Uncharacterized protein n=1 Tax=Bauhinia variegata TaxID=167791 RepID=A0ACB9QCI8_BAUVA|nr:hypothetical protein L6164_001469 [Bauhinia variegata]
MKSVNAFFNGYVNRKTTLKQFVDQYDNALLDKAEKEFEADFHSFSGSQSCATNSPFERQYQSAYTHAKFLEIRGEFTRKADCNVRIAHDRGSICGYNIIEDMMIGETLKEAVYEVSFDRVNCDIECTCHLFEFKGILCRHSLAVLSLERVKEIPCKYILDRWRKTLKRRHTSIKSSYSVKQLKPQTERLDLLCKQFDDVAQVAAEFEETSSFVKGALCELKQKLEAWTNCLRNSYEVVMPISSVTEGWNHS